jgi:hypothetical protein
MALSLLKLVTSSDYPPFDMDAVILNFSVGSQESVHFAGALQSMVFWVSSSFVTALLQFWTVRSAV